MPWAVVTEFGGCNEDIRLFNDEEAARYYGWQELSVEFDSYEHMSEEWEYGDPDLLIQIWDLTEAT